MHDAADNNANLALDNATGDEVILRRNVRALTDDKSAELREIASAMTSIPAALVNMKWRHRREIYAYQVKEEITVRPSTKSSPVTRS